MSYTVVRGKRRLVVVVAAASLASATPLFPAGARAGADEPGQGFAFGQGFKVDPKAGGLSIGIAFGQSTATHQNQVGRAVSTSTNFGVVGLTLAGQNCDGTPPTWALGTPPQGQPQPLIVDSRDTGAANWKTATDWGQPDTDKGPFVKEARATNTPFGEAVTTVLGGSDPSKSFAMGNSLVRSYSGLVDGVREAGATVDLDYLKIGPLFLSQLRWDAVHRSTGTKKSEGRFTFGTMTFNGTTTPGSSNSQTDQLAMVNDALKLVGVKLVPGKVRTSAAGVTVDPLAIVVEPNTTRDTAPQTALSTVQPARELLFKAILETRIPADNPNTPQNENQGGFNGCRAGTYISVADIVTGSVTGAGEFILSFGGVEAATGVSPKNDFNLELGKFGTIGDIDIPGEPPLESSFLGIPDIVDGPAVPFAALPVSGQASAAAAAAPTTRLAAPAGSSRTSSPFKGARGGALAAVALVTLGVLALVAEGDRRAMRRTLLEPR